MSEAAGAGERLGGVAILAASSLPALSGSEAQIEWAGRIRHQVVAEFSRVAAAFEAASARQSEAKRAQTAIVLAILETKREEVLGITRAGYFIHAWQEIGDQVRKLIALDPRFQAVKEARKAAKK